MSHFGALGVELLACPSCGQPSGAGCVTRTGNPAPAHITRWEPLALVYGEGRDDEEEWWQRNLSNTFSQRIVCPVHKIPDCSPLLNGCSLPNHLTRYRDGLARDLRVEVTR